MLIGIAMPRLRSGLSPALLDPLWVHPTAAFDPMHTWGSSLRDKAAGALSKHVSDILT